MKPSRWPNYVLVLLLSTVLLFVAFEVAQLVIANRQFHNCLRQLQVLELRTEYESRTGGGGMGTTTEGLDTWAQDEYVRVYIQCDACRNQVRLKWPWAE